MNTSIIYPKTMLSPVQYDLPQVLERGHVLSGKDSERLARTVFSYNPIISLIDHIVDDGGYKLIRHTRSRRITLWEY